MEAPHEPRCPSDLGSPEAYKLQLRHHSEAGVPPEDHLAAQLVGHPTRGGPTLLPWLSANERTGYRSQELQKPDAATMVTPAQQRAPASPPMMMGGAWGAPPTSPPVQCRRGISMPGTKEAAVQPPMSPPLAALKQQRPSGSGNSAPDASPMSSAEPLPARGPFSSCMPSLRTRTTPKGASKTASSPNSPTVHTPGRDAIGVGAAFVPEAAVAAGKPTTALLLRVPAPVERVAEDPCAEEAAAMCCEDAPAPRPSSNGSDDMAVSGSCGSPMAGPTTPMAGAMPPPRMSHGGSTPVGVPRPPSRLAPLAPPAAATHHQPHHAQAAAAAPMPAAHASAPGGGALEAVPAVAPAVAGPPRGLPAPARALRMTEDVLAMCNDDIEASIQAKASVILQFLEDVSFAAALPRGGVPALPASGFEDHYDPANDEFDDQWEWRSESDDGQDFD